MTTGARPFFDAMAESYDDLEPWYDHLYAVLHGLVRAELRPPPGAPRLRLFTRSALHRLLDAHGLTRVRSWGVHGITNVIPSPVLHRATLGRATGALYRGLCAVDRTLAATRAGRALANSLVVLAVKGERRAPAPTSRQAAR